MTDARLLDPGAAAAMAAPAGGGLIDLSSDTQTRPTVGMRTAIAAAEVGDEQQRGQLQAATQLTELILW